MSLRKLIIASTALSFLMATPILGTAIAQEASAQEAATATAQNVSSQIKALTDIVMRDHVEQMIEHNYWNATELYFSQRQDIDMTRDQLDELRELSLPQVSVAYDKAMPPVNNLMAAIFSDEDASELTSIIAEGGVSGALETDLGQRFSREALPVINEAMDSLVFDQVFKDLQGYREATTQFAIDLGYLPADIAASGAAEFDVSAPTNE